MISKFYLNTYLVLKNFSDLSIFNSNKRKKSILLRIIDYLLTTISKV